MFNAVCFLLKNDCVVKGDVESFFSSPLALKACPFYVKSLSVSRGNLRKNFIPYIPYFKSKYIRWISG